MSQADKVFMPHPSFFNQNKERTVSHADKIFVFPERTMSLEDKADQKSRVYLECLNVYGQLMCTMLS